jgi:polyisoprenyl-phosphate glycosyltransferase
METSALPRSQLRVLIVMPVHDDWTSAAELVQRIDKCVPPLEFHIEIILIDDGSALRWERSMFRPSFSVVRKIQILRLHLNVGHQRAIAIGLMHAKQINNCDAIVVMDADGEDTAEGVLQLLRAYSNKGGAIAIFAERSRRLESPVFRLFYLCYKIMHRCLTGVSIRVGNFSVLPAQYLGSLSIMSELWNHYAAAVFRSKLPFNTIPIPRGPRIGGTSQMNFVGLVSHGLSAMSVFGDVVGVRVLVLSLIGSLLTGIGIFAVITTRVFTNWAIPGWATYATGLLVIILFQLITIAASFTFVVLLNRTNFNFLPFRDHAPFIAEIIDLYSHE